jgi:hypothetical protein
MDLLTGGSQVELRRLIPGTSAPGFAAALKLAGPRERPAIAYFLNLSRLLGREKVLAVMPGYLSIHW